MPEEREQLKTVNLKTFPEVFPPVITTIHTLNSYNIALRAVFGFQYLAQGHFDTLAVEARTQTTGLSISR